jgi:hypothetical protein
LGVALQNKKITGLSNSKKGEMRMPTYLYILLLIGLTIIGLVFSNLTERKQKKLLQIQAEKRAGQVDYFISPRLLLPIGNLILQVYSISGTNSRQAQTIATLGAETIEVLANELARFPKIEITKNTILQKSVASLGQQRFLSGNENFDKTFTIHAENDVSVRRVLTSDIQQNFLALSAKSPSLKIGQDIKSVTFFSVAGIIKDTNTYDLFIETAVSILKNFV